MCSPAFWRWCLNCAESVLSSRTREYSQKKSRKFLNLRYSFHLNSCYPSWHHVSSSPLVHIQPLVQVSHLLPLLFSFSRSVFIKAGSYYTLRVSASTTDWGSAEGRGQCSVEGFFFLLVFFPPLSSVGVVGRLRSLSPVMECMLRCPGLTLPHCVCACVQIGWVRALLLSRVLIKGAFEMVSKTTIAVAWDEKYLHTGGV